MGLRGEREKDRAVRRSLSIRPAHPAPARPRALAAGLVTGPAARGSVGERPGCDVGDPGGGLVEIGVAVFDLPRQRDGA